MFNVICNETNEVVTEYKTKAGADKYAKKLNAYRSVRVEEAGSWVPCETDPTAEKKDAELFSKK